MQTRPSESPAEDEQLAVEQDRQQPIGVASEELHFQDAEALVYAARQAEADELRRGEGIQSDRDAGDHVRDLLGQLPGRGWTMRHSSVSGGRTRSAGPDSYAIVRFASSPYRRTV